VAGKGRSRRGAGKPPARAPRLAPPQAAWFDDLARALEEVAPGAVRRRVDREGRGFLEVSGIGKRRLPGMRVDRREHRLSAAYDGDWLQLKLEVAGDLVDSLALPLPKAPELRAAREFFARHAPRIRSK
jgi:hypothetical protein